MSVVVQNQARGGVIFSVIGCPDFPQLPCQKNLPGAKKVITGPNTDAGFCQRIHAMWRSWVGGQFLLLFIDQKNQVREWEGIEVSRKCSVVV